MYYWLKKEVLLKFPQVNETEYLYISYTLVTIKFLNHGLTLPWVPPA